MNKINIGLNNDNNNNLKDKNNNISNNFDSILRNIDYKKKIIIKEDGRYLIYYDFDDR